MTQKLFNVTVMYNVVVAAKDFDDAYFQAEEYDDAIYNLVDPAVTVNAEITSVEELGDWCGAIPINGNGLTCNEILRLQDESNKEKLIEYLTNEQKNEILLKITFEEIVNLLNKND